MEGKGGDSVELFRCPGVEYLNCDNFPRRALRPRRTCSSHNNVQTLSDAMDGNVNITKAREGRKKRLASWNRKAEKKQKSSLKLFQTFVDKPLKLKTGGTDQANIKEREQTQGESPSSDDAKGLEVMDSSNESLTTWEQIIRFLGEQITAGVTGQYCLEVADCLQNATKACESEGCAAGNVRFCSYDLSAIEPPNRGVKGSEDTILRVLRVLPKALKAMECIREVTGKDEAEMEFVQRFLRRIDSKGEGMLLHRALSSMEKETCPLFSRFDDLLESVLRYLLRRFFNPPMRRERTSKDKAKTSISSEDIERERSMFLQAIPQSGSYEFNHDDVGSYVRDALVTLHHTKPIVDEVILFSPLNDDPEETQEENELELMIEAYVESRRFLLEVFSPQNKVVCDALARDSACFDMVREFCDLAREFNILTYVAIAPLGDVKRLRKELLSQEPLAQAARGWLDAKAQKKKQPVAKQKRRKKASSGYTKRKRRGAKTGDDSVSGKMKFPKLVPYSADIAEDTNCGICEKVVAEKNVGGEMCCDVCQKWYHLKCLSLPPDYPQSVGEYACPKCSEGDGIQLVNSECS